MKKARVINMFHSIGEIRISERAATYDSKGKNYRIEVNVPNDKLNTEKIASNKALAFAMKNADIALKGRNKFICNSLNALVIIDKTEDTQKVNVSVEEIIRADFVDGLKV